MAGTPVNTTPLLPTNIPDPEVNSLRQWDADLIQALYKELFVHANAINALQGIGSPQFRTVLTANTTYYVRKDGNNGNTGLADNAGGAFLTIQKAIDVVAGTIDRSTFSVSIIVRDGTYVENVILKPGVGANPINITGNTVTPANVVIDGGTGSAMATNSPLGDTLYNLTGFKVIGSGGFFFTGVGKVTFSLVRFASTSIHMTSDAGMTIVGSNYFVDTSGAIHALAQVGGFITCDNTVITIPNAITLSFFVFSAGLARASFAQVTFTGKANVTGQRFVVQQNAVVFTGNGGPTYLPGTIDGQEVTGGRYA